MRTAVNAISKAVHESPPSVQSPQVLYISSFQFSGSTLLSFLLNNHSLITTVGHTAGWPYAEDEDFFCSCGKVLEKCPFYNEIERAFLAANLPFDYRHFGTEFRLGSTDRANRFLVGGIRFIQSSAFERSRDHLVSVIPSWQRKIARQQEANKVFIETALRYSRARVFLDNSHQPYRARLLNNSKFFRLANIHLIRDPRAVALSCMKNLGWTAQESFDPWLRQQLDIIRISKEFPSSMLIHYEQLCEDVSTTLARVHQSVGLDFERFEGDFKATENHILGNDMRLKEGVVRLDTKWKTRLPIGDQERIADRVRAAMDSARDPELRSILEFYVD